MNPAYGVTGVDADEVAVLLNCLPARVIVSLGKLKSLLAVDVSFADLIATHRVVFGEPSDSEVDIVVECRGSVPDAPGGLGVGGDFPVILVDERRDNLIFDPLDVVEQEHKVMGNNVVRAEREKSIE